MACGAQVCLSHCPLLSGLPGLNQGPLSILFHALHSLVQAGCLRISSLRQGKETNMKREKAIECMWILDKMLEAGSLRKRVSETCCTIPPAHPGSGAMSIPQHHGQAAAVILGGVRGKERVATPERLPVQMLFGAITRSRYQWTF